MNRLMHELSKEILKGNCNEGKQGSYKKMQGSYFSRTKWKKILKDYEFCPHSLNTPSLF